MVDIPDVDRNLLNTMSTAEVVVLLGTFTMVQKHLSNILNSIHDSQTEITDVMVDADLNASIEDENKLTQLRDSTMEKIIALGNAHYDIYTGSYKSVSEKVESIKSYLKERTGEQKNIL